jgi:hypothetical protein
VNTDSKGLILAGLYLGQRLGDIARIRLSHLDLEHAEVSIVTEKTGCTQIIPIAAPLLRFIIEELPVRDDPTAALFLVPMKMSSASGGSDHRAATFYEILVRARLVAPEKASR